MELLKIRDKGPYKDRNSNIEFLRDWCCLYLNDDLDWEFYLNGDIKTGKGMRVLEHIIKKLIKEKNSRLKVERETRLVVWVNSLTQYKLCVNLLDPTLKPVFYTTYKKGVKENILMLLESKDLEIRNFDMIAGEPIEEIKESYSLSSEGVKIMVDFLKKREQQGLHGWGQIRYSKPNNDLKLFYKRFNKEHLKEMMYEVKRRVPSIETYQILQSASKKGLMAFNAAFQNTMLTNVYSFDISSAYDAQFVRGNDFPIGKIRLGDIKDLPDLIAQNKWFIIRMVSPYEIEDRLPMWITSEEKDDLFYYTIGNYDYKIIQESGDSLNKINRDWKIDSVLVCDKQGYLNYHFREEEVKLYSERLSEKLKNNKQKEKELKAMQKFIYGKGIQKREFETNTKIEDFYRNRNNVYIDAQISLHALQRTRYELFTMLKRLNSSYVAFDTDCIKTQSIMAPRLFEERNKEIMEENERAGFPGTTIGLWKPEGLYPHFIQFGNKVYAYEKNGKIECTFAGCLKNAWENYFSNFSLEEGLKELNKPDLAIPNGIIKKAIKKVEDGNFIYEKIPYSYSVRGGQEKDFKEEFK